jgi:hypothetical protein
MKHLKKFNESKDSDLEVLKEYFYNLVDDLENICTLEFKRNTSNYYTLYIEQLERISGSITKDTTNKIDTWISSSDKNSKILQELKSSISKLGDDNIIESFKLQRNIKGYSLEIYTKLKDEDSIQWIFIEEDYTVWIDELRLKKYLESKFDVKLDSAKFMDDYDRRNERFLLLNINLDREYPVKKLQEIIEDLNTIEVKNEEAEIQMKIFTRGTNFRLRETSDTFNMFLDSDVVDFQ